DLRGAPASIGSLTADGGDAATLDAVRGIIADVRARGDAALRELTHRFDGATIDDLRVPADELAAAFAAAAPELQEALEHAAARIRAYHEAQAVAPAAVALRGDGIDVEELVRPV